ncbi:C1-like protein [Tanacetum coccineum]|uniref:C1-like protein n=1 Tax=Tanacetum coccineum TaxID=301880 RepID=A0ABQ4ZKW8_9ASTR
MGEINHFSHEVHSLKLIENWETTVDDVGEKKGEVHCEGCLEPISLLGGSAYACIECGYFLHKTCAELTPVINHHIHPLHPLTLKHKYNRWSCDVCGARHIARGFSYKCVECDFDSCLKCAAAIAPKDATLIKLKHEGHSQHTLTLQSRSASFLCDACHTKDEDFFYQCNDCDFWIHKFYREFCNKVIIRNDWLYHCANCRYFSHIKCALNAQLRSTPRDDPSTSVDEEHVKDLLQFPMPYAFTDPLKLLHSGKVTHEDDETNEINHWSHPDHPIILNVEPHGNSLTSVNSGDLIQWSTYGMSYACEACGFHLDMHCATRTPQSFAHRNASQTTTLSLSKTQKFFSP